MKKKSYGTVVLKRDRKFAHHNTQRGRANKAEVLARLGLKEEGHVQPKYFMVDGVPHKFDENGNKVPLKKTSKDPDPIISAEGKKWLDQVWPNTK